MEAVRFDRRRILSRDWGDYPILTFSEVPPVEVAIVDRPASRSWAPARPRRARRGGASPTRCSTPAALASATCR
jgi:CO/xanthine dehydrogenase Mo-binding subunit